LTELLLDTELERPVHSRGKVRDTYRLQGGRLLMVATDRISAFDHVLPNGIPDKGKVLTQLSIFWFGQTHAFQENHLVSGMVPDLPAELRDRAEELRERFMIVRQAQRIDVECVVRGYMAGSGWIEYERAGTVCGIPLPAGLRQAEKLPQPIFTPATKAVAGHDENISFDELASRVGADVATRLRDASLELYRHAAELVEPRGLILADTKFEFGWIEGRLTLIDELLTPDSSRYWDRARHRLGTSPRSYDKQFVRDWLLQSGWDRESDPPPLPDDIVEQTRQRYLDAYELVTGRPLHSRERV
jgi:phosphoribosylaminoimidazole-succinocarboxamide synthase